MSNIKIQQNLPQNLKLLTAQRQLYSEAKKIRNIRILGTTLLTIISPLIFFFTTKLIIPLAIIGCLWSIFAFVIKSIENDKKKSAALIQEEFDTSVYNLPWNFILAKESCWPEKITSAERRYKADRKCLENWYGDLKDLTYPLDILFCQRSNLVWDSRQRRSFALAIVVLLILIFSAGIALYWHSNKTISEYFLGILIPSLSAYFQGIDEIMGNFKDAFEKEGLEKRLEKLFREIKNSTSRAEYNKSELRQIQDIIFKLRENSPLIPDWWYKLFRNKYQLDMQATIDIFNS
ncbi:MAG: S-4TM family putative pore-forming effector [Patescibacteria group bacterium]|jgi:hypothetical protein